jgi:hypothetical protein
MTWNKTLTSTIAPMTDIRLHWLPRAAKPTLPRAGQWQFKNADCKRAYRLLYHQLHLRA